MIPTLSASLALILLLGRRANLLVSSTDLVIRLKSSSATVAVDTSRLKTRHQFSMFVGGRFWPMPCCQATSTRLLLSSPSHRSGDLIGAFIDVVCRPLSSSSSRAFRLPKLQRVLRPAWQRRPTREKYCMGPSSRPVGGYPPPPHLNGVFAVYKPKSWSSADAVQRIKNVLTKGVRDELQAREGIEAAATLEAGQAERTASRDDGSAVNGERHEVEIGAADSEGQIAAGGDRKIAKTNKQQPNHRPKGPKVKVGHGGTLDPMATGVLVIGVGTGCRDLTGYLSGCKAYRAEALLGWETNTQDAEGEETVRGEWEHVTTEAVNDALGQFTGHIMQVPPMFSAIKKDGKRMYDLARQGQMVERDARPATVYGLRQVDPPLPLPRLGLEIECGGGFYVRTLIEDLSRALDTRGHMSALERTKQGPFKLEHALPEEDWTYDQLCRHLEESQEIIRRNGGVESEDEVTTSPVAQGGETAETKVAVAVE